jgi:hypothetical protein
MWLMVASNSVVYPLACECCQRERKEKRDSHGEDNKESLSRSGFQ